MATPPSIEELKKKRRTRAVLDVEESRPRGITGAILENGSITASAGLPGGYTWVRIGAKSKYDNVPAVAAFNTTVPNKPGLPVRLELISGGQWSIYSLDETRAVPEYGSSVGTVAVPTADGRELNLIVPGENFLPGRGKRSTGLAVTIDAFTAGGVDVPTQEVTLVPTATASMKAWAALYFLPGDGLIHQILSDDHALSDTMTRAQIFSEITFPDGHVKLKAYVLENGQTALTATTQNEDIREYLNVNEDIGGGHGILIDDVPQTQRGDLNLLSSNWLVAGAADDAGNNETEFAYTLDPTGVSDIGTVDGSADKIPIWDASASAMKSVSPDDLPGGGGGSANHAYYARLAALLEPDALEPFQVGTFSYAIASNVTKYLMASFYTRLNSAGGTMDVRDPRKPLPLRDATLQGVDTGSTAIILDPTLPTYTDAYTTYYDRLLALDDLPTKYLAFAAASTSYLFLPSAYGVIITNVTGLELAWIIGRLGGTYGFNLANEIGDASGDHWRWSNRLCLPLNRNVIDRFETGQSPGSPLGSITFVRLPSTWSAVTDPNTYAFRDDFMGATLDTTTDWTRAQSTAGNVEINVVHQWCGMVGNGSWGGNGMFSQTGITRTAGKIFECYVHTPASGNPNLVVGWHDGAGQSYADFAHGLDFTSGVFNVFENSNARGVVGSGWSADTTYRVRITLGTSDATYEIQGGAYQPLGGAAWTDITPGTSSSTTTPVHAGVTIQSSVSNCYVGDVKVY